MTFNQWLIVIVVVVVIIFGGMLAWIFRADNTVPIDDKPEQQPLDNNSTPEKKSKLSAVARKFKKSPTRDNSSLPANAPTTVNVTKQPNPAISHSHDTDNKPELANPVVDGITMFRVAPTKLYPQSVFTEDYSRALANGDIKA